MAAAITKRRRQERWRLIEDQKRGSGGPVGMTSLKRNDMASCCRPTGRGWSQSEGPSRSHLQCAGAAFPKRSNYFPTPTSFGASHIGVEISCAAQLRAGADPRLTEACHRYAWVNRKDIGGNPNVVERKPELRGLGRAACPDSGTHPCVSMKICASLILQKAVRNRTSKSDGMPIRQVGRSVFPPAMVSGMRTSLRDAHMLFELTAARTGSAAGIRHSYLSGRH
jgi:hypothetical protein